MTPRETEIADIMNHAFACQASGRARLSNLRNREELAKSVVAATLDADDEHLHGAKLLNRVRKNCGLGPMEVIAVIGFIINLIRLVIEYRRNKEEQESEGGHA